MKKIVLISVLALAFMLGGSALALPQWTFDNNNLILHFTRTSDNHQFDFFLAIAELDEETGDFYGTATRSDNSNLFIIEDGNIDTDVAMMIIRDNNSNEFTVTGAINPDGSMIGTADASNGNEFTWTADAGVAIDYDGDGLVGEADYCPGTVADELDEESLGVNRHIWNGDYFKTLVPGKKGMENKIEISDFTISRTHGCSCEQIVAIMEEKTGLEFEGHEKYGCSKGLIEDWISGTYYVGPTFLETVEVSGTTGTPVESVNALEVGKDYFLTAKGTYRFANWGGDFGLADAEFSNRLAQYTPDGIAGWIAGEGYFQSACGLDVQVDGTCVNWGELDLVNHEYTIDYTGTDSPVSFHIYDSGYTDNSGSIFVDIIEDKWVDLW